VIAKRVEEAPAVRRRLWLALAAAAALCAAAASAAVLWFTSAPSGALHVVVADVGQGSLVVARTPLGATILIDAGPSETATLRALGRTAPRVQHIALVVATHPDVDHIGGLSAVLRRYKVHELWVSPAVSEQVTDEDVLTLARERGVVVREITEPRVWESPEGVKLTALFPERALASSTPTNTASIVLRLSYGGASFLASGDAPREVEHYLAALYGRRLASDIVLVGHHGSRTSTDEWWLNAAAPRLAVISAGADNPFGHPHPEVLAMLERFAIPWCLTSRDGDIELVSYGAPFLLPRCARSGIGQ
jgi:competence protein ComEC